MFEMFEQFEKQGQEQGFSEVASGAPSREVFVISAGGSLFFDEKPLSSKIAKFCETINRLHSEGFRFVVVVGGGKVTRNYVAALKSFGANNFLQDQLGIMLTRANAMVFVQALDNSFKEVLTHPKEAFEVLEKGKIPVFGGVFPFFTTDAVAALICEVVGGTFVNLTDVDGVYSSDPQKNPAAKFFDTISYEKLISLVKLAGSKPGQNMVLDLASCMILKRSNIKGVVLNGENLENFEAMVRGQEFRGTVIFGENEQSGIEDQVQEFD